jgi:hypothetical protein
MYIVPEEIRKIPKKEKKQSFMMLKSSNPKSKNKNKKFAVDEEYEDDFEEIGQDNKKSVIQQPKEPAQVDNKFDSIARSTARS